MQGKGRCPVVNEISMSEFGLVTVEEAASFHECEPRTVQKWIKDGLIPVLRAGPGQRCVYLLREKDVKAFTAPPMGRPKKEKPPARKRK
jgi:excisionase family DNA binding protein